MNWILGSLIMFFSSVALYLLIRKSSLLKYPVQFNNLAMFSVPLLIYLLIGITSGVSYSITATQLFEIIIMAFIFSYLGNVSSLRGIELAPNPGYALVISKSYVVFTTIFSILFLDGEFTYRKILAIIIIVIFSAVVTIDPEKTKKKKNLRWFWFSIFSFFAWGFLSLSIKFLAIQGLGTLPMLTYLYTFVTIFIILESYKKKVSFRVNRSFLNYFLGIGVLSSLFNYFNFYSVSIAPNVGYVNAINAGSISLVTIFSIVLFKDEYSLRKLTGVIGVILGMLMLIL